MFLTCTHFFIMLNTGVKSEIFSYLYYFLSFVSYHLYFTFSKRYWLKVLVIVRGYFINKDYLKLILWFFFVFITSLFGNKFVILAVFNPLLLLSIISSNFIITYSLLLIWSWMFVLIFSNKLGIQTYFYRKGCLHFIGNSPGTTLGKKIGPFIFLTPVTISVPVAAGYALDAEKETGNHAITRMHEFARINPESTQMTQYKIYQSTYKSHANSTLVGRQLTKWGVMVPAAPEVIFDDYTTNLAKDLKTSNINQLK